MTTITQDTRNVGSLTGDNRTSVSSITQDDKSADSLWSAANFPWQLEAPWLWHGNGQLLTLETRN